MCCGMGLCGGTCGFSGQITLLPLRPLILEPAELVNFPVARNSPPDCTSISPWLSMVTAPVVFIIPPEATVMTVEIWTGTSSCTALWNETVEPFSALKVPAPWYVTGVVAV